MPSCTASNPSHDFVLVYPLCCNDDRAGEIGRTFHFMTRHDLVLANDRSQNQAGPALVAGSRREFHGQMEGQIFCGDFFAGSIFD
jgi:hypothetical protein